MANTHYCKTHEAVFFKKGKMKGYAHPIEGTEPLQWCNEPEGGGDPMPEEKASELVAEAEGKNRGYALRYAADIACARIQVGKDTSMYEVLDYALIFESYLDTGATIKKKE